jgi:two-component system response regulator AtoC
MMTSENTIHGLRVLIVDDEPELRRALSALLKSSFADGQLQIAEVDNGQSAVDQCAQTRFDLVLMDVRMPVLDGLKALELIKQGAPETFVVIMTAHANLQDAITAIRIGAYDYIEKPVDSKKLIEVVQKALQTQKMVSELVISNPIIDGESDEEELVGSTNKMKEIFQLINRLAHVDTSVLLRGEHGTGKEVVARAIHSNSPEKHGPFVTVNCSAIPEEHLEIELFGQEKTPGGNQERAIGKFQAANRGTLFLDEISCLTHEMQIKLLNVLQEKKFTPRESIREVKINARVIMATNAPLEKLVHEQKLREDFFYKINVMPLFLPPLRDRIDDLPALAEMLIQRHAVKLQSQPKKLSSDTMDILKSYNWPGNIHELEGALEHMLIVESGDQISRSSIPSHIQDSVRAAGGSKSSQEKLDFDRFKEAAEKSFIENALKANDGKINKTVIAANIPKNTLLRKIKKYGIEVAKFTR